MITHKIDPYKGWVAPAPPPYVAPTWPYPTTHVPKEPLPALPAPPGWAGARSPSATKIEYAQFLNKLPFKVGDYVLSKKAALPLMETDYHRIVSMQEIHYLVKDDALTKEPMCIEVKDGVGNRWYTVPSKWFKANSAPIDIPLGL